MASMPSEIEHIVVLMMENRSFDNVLGSLYMDQYSPPVSEPTGWQGLSGSESNTCAQTGKPVDVWNWRNPPSGYVPPCNPYTMPNPNPHEHYMYVWWELYGDKPPTDIPPPPTRPPDMSGFASTYYDKLPGSPAFSDYAQIMHYLAPADLPVTSALAYNYGVCDRWFASVPTQTYANRLFSLIGTSNGIVNNGQWLGECGDRDQGPADACLGATCAGYISNESIFSQLDSGGAGLTSPAWKVYYTNKSLARQLEYVNANANTQLAEMSAFYSDLQNEKLPSFSWLEPSYGQGSNSNHPPDNVLVGEGLITSIFEELKASSYWEKTLFVITYDEHGGLYDHVSPPSGMVAPQSVPSCEACYDVTGFPPSYQGNFDFTRYGVRVPTILISPQISPGTLLTTADGSSAQFDHTSLIRMVFDTFGVEGKLDDRDESAPGVADVFTNVGGELNNGPALKDVLPPKGSPAYRS